MTLEELHSQSITILNSPISPKKIVYSKWWYNRIMIKYTSRPIILQNTRAFGSTSSQPEELCSQNITTLYIEIA